MFKRRRNSTPTVELFEVTDDGAAFAWTDDASRAMAFRMLVELVRRLEGASTVRRLTLHGRIGTPIDAAEVDEFVRLAPELIKRLHQAYDFELRLNDGRSYVVRPLDQSTSGFWVVTPLKGEIVWSTLAAVLKEFSTREIGVRIDTGPWYPQGLV